MDTLKQIKQLIELLKTEIPQRKGSVRLASLAALTNLQELETELELDELDSKDHTNPDKRYQN